MASPETDPLKDKRVELVLEQLEELPTLPAVAIRVLEVTSNDATSAREVISLIESDPSLTARILKLVHRADAGVRAEVNSVDRAVVLLGFEAVRSAVLAVSMFETFGPSVPAETVRSTNQAARVSTAPAPATFSREAFWKHSIAVAACAELIARSLQGAWGKDARVDPGEAFVCGLLHDLGKVALDAALPKSFAKVVEASEILRGNIADVERQIVGIDHMVVGKRLAEKWKLPPPVRDCAWLHGQAPNALPATVTKPRLVNIVTLADIIAREQHLGYSGNYAFPLSRKLLADAVGITDAKIAEIEAKLVEAIEHRATALGISRASTGELYQQALAQANRELGRVSTQLAVRNKKLAVRAKFFDALAEFHNALSADAPPSLVLRAVAETAIEALGVPAAVAFSVPPGRNYAEMVLTQKAGDAETLLTDCAARPPWTAAPGSIVEATDGLEFVLSVVSPRLGGSRRYWTALVAEGEVVGGVAWGSPDDESQRYEAMRVELAGLSAGWSLALRTSQIRDEARLLAEQLAEANRNLQDAQGELTRARTLTTIAEMAAGAAHEMNNPLAVISGRSQLLASVLTDEKHKRSASLIAEQSDRLSGMITELMEFAKPKAAAPTDAAVRDLAAAAVDAALARPGITPNRRVNLNLTDVPPVHVDPEQIRLALTEVIDNALQATEAPLPSPTNPTPPPHGTVTVTAAHDPFGGNVVITVVDDGVGMDEHTLRRAFDPFYSSKPAGRRRGMGLAKAQRWIEGCGGSIRLESRSTLGTRAMLLLPAATPATASSHRVAG